jgi:aminoglycoside 2'-N-acetyltransferase I
MLGIHFLLAHSITLDRAARAEIIGLCEAAYQEDFSRLFESFPDAVHLLARADDGVLVSHAEFVPRRLQPAGSAVLRTAYVEAVATAPGCRRRGLATAVMQRLTEAAAADATWELAALSPSDAGFYGRRGWELWRGPLAIRRQDGVVEATPADEQVMIRRLPRTPTALDPAALLIAEWREGELW